MDIEVSPADSAGSQRQDPAPDQRGALRRRLLGIGIGGAAAALAPAIVGRVAASTPPTTTTTTTASGSAGGAASTTTTSGSGSTSTAPATTTTAPPKRPTEADLPLLTFAQGAELAAYQLYQTALKANLDDEQRNVLAVIGQSHLSYGQALSGLLGPEGKHEPDQSLIDSQSSAFGGDANALLKAAGKLESTLVATHMKLVGTLVGTDAIYLLSSIVTVEARNGTVLAELGGATDLSQLLVDDEAGALTPAKG